MRVWFLKFAGFALWAAFLFAPFVARADSGFDIFLPQAMFAEVEQKEEGVLFSLGGLDLSLDDRDGFKLPVEKKMDIKLNARKDTVLHNKFNQKISQDRIPLDDGHRESFIFGLKLNYTLN